MITRIQTGKRDSFSVIFHRLFQSGTIEKDPVPETFVSWQLLNKETAGCKIFVLKIQIAVGFVFFIQLHDAFDFAVEIFIDHSRCFTVTFTQAADTDMHHFNPEWFETPFPYFDCQQNDQRFPETHIGKAIDAVENQHPFLRDSTVFSGQRVIDDHNTRSFYFKLQQVGNLKQNPVLYFKHFLFLKLPLQF
jgi:hypothetical protein